MRYVFPHESTGLINDMPAGMKQVVQRRSSVPSALQRIETNGGFKCEEILVSSVVKKRRKKMNKHKLKKRRKKQHYKA